MSINGEFILYAARFAGLNNARLKIVKNAVRRVARKLNFKVEIAWRESVAHIFVCYRSDLGVEIPVYSDFRKECDVEAVYRAIINILFVLSFHPRYNALKSVRREVMQFS